MPCNKFTKNELHYNLKKLGLPRKIATSKGTREMTRGEKLALITKTKKFKTAFALEGKKVGKNTILFRGKRYTRSGVLL